MNAENFASYLKNPAYLYQISYQELKSLVMQYPYCQNLRYMLLKKSRLDHHMDYERNLQLAATYSIDRRFLHQLIQEEDVPEVAEESIIASEEFLELPDLSAPLDEPEKEMLTLDNLDDTTTISTSTDAMFGLTASVQAAEMVSDIVADVPINEPEDTPEDLILEVENLENEALELPLIEPETAIAEEAISEHVELENLTEVSSETLELTDLEPENEILRDINDKEEVDILANTEEVAEALLDNKNLLEEINAVETPEEKVEEKSAELTKEEAAAFDELLDEIFAETTTIAALSSSETDEAAPVSAAELQDLFDIDDDISPLEVEVEDAPIIAELSEVHRTEENSRVVEFEMTNVSDESTFAQAELIEHEEIELIELTAEETIETSSNVELLDDILNEVEGMTSSSDEEVSPTMQEGFVPLKPEETETDRDVFEEVELDAPISDEQEQPEAKSSFSSWLRQFQSPQMEGKITIEVKEQSDKYRYELVEGEWIKKRIKAKKKKKKSKVEQIADQSVKQNISIATETLAKLLEQQGHYKRAIAMFEQLRLEMPEKSEFFARKIEDLKDKLD